MNATIPRLRDWRKNKGISLDSVASETKLSVRLPQAFDTSDFRTLPGGIHNSNYIRQYEGPIGFGEPALPAWYEEASRGGFKDATAKKNGALSWALL
jgi:cytoskeletal protein RodZ